MADVTDFEEEKANLPQNLAARVREISLPHKRRERAATYRALLDFCRFAGKTEVRLAFDGRGKPHDAAGQLSLSLSHDAGFCAVALGAPECAVGVDICRGAAEPARAGRVRARFLSDFRMPQPLAAHAVCWFFGRYGAGGFDFVRMSVGALTDSFVRDFTLTESVLKAEGGGFRSLGALGSLMETCRGVSALTPQGMGVSAVIQTRQEDGSPCSKF